MGCEVYDRLEKAGLPNIEIITDFQLQIEHTLDLDNRDRVLFVDASVSSKSPFEFRRVRSLEDNSYTSHALSPEALLAVYEKTNASPAPSAYILLIRGYEFELGEAMTEKATNNRESALTFLLSIIESNDAWDSFL